MSDLNVAVDAWWVRTQTDPGSSVGRSDGALPAGMETDAASSRRATRVRGSQPERRPCIGEVIRERRRELGLTQEELALRVCRLGDDLRQSDISRMENGKVTLPRYQRVARIATALELPLGELLSRAGWDGADAAPWHDDESGPDGAIEPVVTSPARRIDPGTADLDDVMARAELSIARAEEILRRCREAVAS